MERNKSITNPCSWGEEGEGRRVGGRKEDRGEEGEGRRGWEPEKNVTSA